MNELITGMDQLSRGKLRIAVFPAFSGAGASFVCGSLAYLAANKTAGLTAAGASLQEPRRRPAVSLIELGRPYFYQALSFEKREGLYPFCSVRKLLEERKSLQSAENLKDGVNWLIREPQDLEGFEAGKLFRLISSAPGGICFFDCSGIFCGGKGQGTSFPDPADIAAEMDISLFVIDPMPTRLLEASSSIASFLLEVPEALVVVNKNNSGVHERELRRFLGRRSFFSVGHMPPELIYKAEYGSKLPAAIAPSNEIIAQLGAIVENIL